ncbi:MAG: hypothetical protein GY744_06150 [Gammaproteobacteria bacterium]|nr:hypothetical protein [Gammaproteobacteria bacterium]
MIGQTIALFRYQLLGIINTRISILLCLIFTVAFIGSQFIAELAILNSDAIALASMADFLRYSLVIFLVISLSFQVSQDYESGQFERLLVMPLTRVQYVIAQFIVLLVLAFVLILPLFLLVMLFSDFSVALYWAAATFLELLLVGQFALLAIISLEKLPLSVIFTIAIYLLSKSTSLIQLVLSRSTPFYDEESGFQFVLFVFTTISYVLPDASYFAQNNIFFGSASYVELLTGQFVSVVLYSAFIQSILLVDFYRKEFN